MYILKNALRSIGRAKGRNILIGVIVLVIAVSSCLALSIRKAAETAREETLSGLEVTAQISLDRMQLMENAEPGSHERPDMSSMLGALQGADSLTLEEMETYAQAECVKDFTYSLTASLNSADEDTFAPVDTSVSFSEENSENAEENTMPGPGGDMPGDKDQGAGPAGKPGMGSQGDFTVIGYSFLNAMADFVSGTSTVTEGTVFDEDTEELQCLVSDELATLNSLSVGDTIELMNPNDEEEIVTFTITGIYSNSESSTLEGGRMGGFSAAGDPANEIYTSYAALKKVADTSAENAETAVDEETGVETSTAIRTQLSGVYSFASAEAYEKFEEEARGLGLDDAYSISSSDLKNYENSLIPLENLSKFALYFLIVVLAIGVIILIVLNIFTIRDRKYEIGVLTAIGMKKRKVALQFIIELFIVTFSSILIGVAVGAAVSVPTTNALLETQISAQQEQQNTIANNFGRPNMPSDRGEEPQMMQNAGMEPNGGNTYIDQVSSATDWTVVLQLMGIGVLLTIVSSCAAMVFILRYDPLKILTNRD